MIAVEWIISVVNYLFILFIHNIWQQNAQAMPNIDEQ